MNTVPPSAVSHRTGMVCTIWREMSGSGAWMLTKVTITTEARNTTLLIIISQMLKSASFVAARGATPDTTFVRRTVATTDRASSTAASVFVVVSRRTLPLSSLTPLPLAGFGKENVSLSSGGGIETLRSARGADRAKFLE